LKPFYSVCKRLPCKWKGQRDHERSEWSAGRRGSERGGGLVKVWEGSTSSYILPPSCRCCRQESVSASRGGLV